MDKQKEMELREKGWVEVGDDLVSPELLKIIKARVEESDGQGIISWEEMEAQVEDSP